MLIMNVCTYSCNISAEKRTKKPACIPYVSEYNDCNEYTTCTGCTQCRCNAEAQWSCYKKRNTCSEDTDDLVVYDDGTDDNSVGKILQELAEHHKGEEKKKHASHRAPLPYKRKRTTEAPALLGLNDEDVMMELKEIMRGARSLDAHNDTHVPIKFHHTVDELNEDTLKNANISGTLGAQKVAPKLSGRRAGVLINSTNNPLQIEYNNPTIYNNHITDNKIEPSHNVDKYDTLVKEKLHNIVNFTQNEKDTELSKLVVNELKIGSETIGDSKAPVATNITFTPEKDTLTAMAFIAGNLLNKLWNLERDSSDSTEKDQEKNQKIADLLDLFKEPLTFRQENFLKNALEQLSTAISKDKNIKNVSLCETISQINIPKLKEEKKPKKVDKDTATGNALAKLNEVLDLIKKYEVVQKNLSDINHLKEGLRNGQMAPIHITNDEKSSLTLFGKILEKITNLLIPKKNSNIKNKIRSQNILSNSHNFDDEVKKAFHIDPHGMKITSQDKLVLDYIRNIQSIPCFTSKLPEDTSMPYKQSDILFNLSEFIKIKSYADFLKLVEPETKVTSTTPTSTTISTTAVNEYPGFRKSINDSSEETENSTLSVNDKLKLHLKAIVNDLIEIEREKGKDIKPGGINIADALPCIVKMLNQDQLPKENNNTRGALLSKVKYVLEAIKKETRERNLPQSRRSIENVGPRPKSAVVWERLIKNLNQDNHPKRRSLQLDESESYETVKKLMDQIEANSSSTFKTVALNKKVSFTGRLTLLKTLALNTVNYANILAKLLKLNREKKLPEVEFNDIIEFVDIAVANFDLNAKVVKSLNKTKPNGFNAVSDHKKPSTERIRTISDTHKVKMTRQQALNQLIKNRVKEYLKVKESESANGDIGYELGERILSNLERGNDKLAQELYKILVQSTPRESTPASSPRTPVRTAPFSVKRPVISADKVKTNKQWVSEDLFLKTLESALANIKTL